jgi:hypothetical protein
MRRSSIHGRPLEDSFLDSRSSIHLRLTGYATQIRLLLLIAQLSSLCFRYIYCPANDEEAEATVSGMKTPLSDARAAILCAGQIYDLVRKARQRSFADPVVLSNATLVLWFFAKYCYDNSKSTETHRPWHPILVP